MENQVYSHYMFYVALLSTDNQVLDYTHFVSTYLKACSPLDMFRVGTLCVCFVCAKKRKSGARKK